MAVEVPARRRTELPALKRVISVETLSQSAKALFPPHKCGGSHLNASAGHHRRLLKKGHSSLEKTTKSLCAILSNCKYR